jgi:hypothetical protein
MKTHQYQSWLSNSPKFSRSTPIASSISTRLRRTTTIRMMMTILILLLIGASSMVVQILFVIFAIVELKLWKHEVAVMLLFG